MNTIDSAAGATWARARLLAVCALFVLALAACAGGDDASPSDDDGVDPGQAMCDLVTSDIEADIAGGMTSVLSGAVAEPKEIVGDACVQRFTSDDRWVEVSFTDATGADDEGLFPVGDTVMTDGGRRSRAILSDRSIDVVVDTSDPASISTWDGSLVAAAALAPAS